MKNRISSILIVCLTLLAACGSEDESCRESRKVSLKIGFYQTGTKTALDADSLTVIAIDADSVLYDNVKKTNKIELLLDIQSEATRYSILFNDQCDTLTVLYRSEPYFISYACGMIYTHQIDTAIWNRPTSYSIRIPEKLVTTADVQHIQLYR